MAWTDPPDFTLNQFVNPATLNTFLVANLKYLYNGRPFCDLAHNSDQALANAAWTPVVFGAEIVDSAAMHDPASNPSRIVVPSAGIYLFYGRVSFGSNAAGNYRNIGIRRNGVDFVAIQNGWPNPVGEVDVVIPAIHYEPTAGSYFELCAAQDTGVVINAMSHFGSPHFTCFKVWQ